MSKLSQQPNNLCSTINKQMASNKRVASVNMPEDLIERADEVADEQDRSRSNLVSRAVRQYCDQHERRKERRDKRGGDISVPA